jgi:hypothetical protein
LLRDENTLLRAEIERLKFELAAAKKDSRNSSKPPSSDIVKPSPSGGRGKRRLGGQPGHQPHFRTPFSPERIDEVEIFEPPSMTCRCGGSLHPHPASDSVRQQIDLRDNPVIRREFRAPAYYSAYHAYLSRSGGEAQFCQAHLIRELRFLHGHSDPETRRYAIRSLAAIRKLFRLSHHARSHPDADQRELTKAGERACRILGRASPKTAAENIATRFRKHGDSYIRFLSNPLVDPTNNRAEQAIRQVVIDRAATQGTRSPKGRAYRERLWTVLSACAKKHGSAFSFILNSLFAHSSNTAPPPSLL